jgi:hypothetical protein
MFSVFPENDAGPLDPTVVNVCIREEYAVFQFEDDVMYASPIGDAVHVPLVTVPSVTREDDPPHVESAMFSTFPSPKFIRA